MKPGIIAGIALFAATASARKCQNLTIPIHASGRNGVFDLKAPKNGVEITDIVLEANRHGFNVTQKLLTGYATVSGHYHIAATYCEPDSGPSSVLQLLTHGIGADRSYWDLPFNNYNYSYSLEAVDKFGFSTFAWDRLGIGQSSHGDPVNEIQALLEVGALKELTLLLRAGKIKGIPQAFETIAHVGHSLGSQHSYTLTAMYPHISDCLLLSGFSQNGSYPSLFLLSSDYLQANTVPFLSDYVDGYIAAGSIRGAQIEFFAPGRFDPAILAYYYANRQPLTVGELLTSAGENADLNSFPGPVHIVTGEHDIPFCGGNCLDPPTGFPNIPSTSRLFFTNPSVFEVTIIPRGGHGLNFEYEHPLTYGIMNRFLIQNGCAPK